MNPVVEDTSTCAELLPLTVGWEFVPEDVSLEGGTREFMREPINVMIVRTPAGWVLLEAGCDPAPYRGVERDPFYGERMPVFATDGDPVLEGLAAHGLEVGDLVGAAVSHLHVDHSGAIPHLAAAGVEVAIQAKELDFAERSAGTPDFYRREDYEVEGIRWRRLVGDGPIFPGIEAIFTPGHTPGHMSYRVRMEDSGTWLFAVDAIDLQRGIDEDVAIGYSADPVDAPLRRRSHDRLLALADEEGARLVPGHCPETWPALTGQSYR